MAIAFRAFAADGIVALFEEASGGGDPFDINSMCNRPALDPESWLPNVYFHSDLAYMEVAGTASTSISHAAVTAGSAPSGQSLAFGWNTASADHLLYTHGLGYEPFAIAIVGGNIVWPGMPVQVDSVGGARYASIYCTTTEVRLYEWASIGTSNLSSTSLTYDVLVFADPPSAAGDQLINFNASTGVLKMGFDKFDSSKRFLQVVAGGSPFGFALGRTIDLANGAMRAYRPDGTSYEPVPPTLASAIISPEMTSTTYGGGMGYNGSYAGPSAVLVQAP